MNTRDEQRIRRIESEIAQTREQIDETFNQIQTRASTEQLVGQALAVPGRLVATADPRAFVSQRMPRFAWLRTPRA